MHAFRCTSCSAPAYSAARLDRLHGGARCGRCGGELVAAPKPRFRALRSGGEPASGRYPLRPGARSSAG